MSWLPPLSLSHSLSCLQTLLEYHRSFVYVPMSEIHCQGYKRHVYSYGSSLCTTVASSINSPCIAYSPIASGFRPSNREILLKIGAKKKKPISSRLTGFHNYRIPFRTL